MFLYLSAVSVWASAAENSKANRFFFGKVYNFRLDVFLYFITIVFFIFLSLVKRIRRGAWEADIIYQEQIQCAGCG